MAHATGRQHQRADHGTREFREWARLMHRASDTLYEDAMIAAIARVHGLTVVMRNIGDFKTIGVKVFNPFGKPVK
jgi:toxin FitB